MQSELDERLARASYYESSHPYYQMEEDECHAGRGMQVAMADKGATDGQSRQPSSVHVPTRGRLEEKGIRIALYRHNGCLWTPHSERIQTRHRPVPMRKIFTIVGASQTIHVSLASSHHRSSSLSPFRWDVHS